MQTFLRRALLPLACVSAAIACTDLTVPPKSAISSATIFNDESSYRAYMARLYAGLAVTGQQGPAGNDNTADIRGIDEGFSHYLRLLWQMNELPTDEAAIAWDDAGVQPLNTQLWPSNNPFLTAMYYRIYFQVGLANDFLRETDDARLAERNVSAATRAQIRSFRAEARFLRALSYWHGIDLFGDIPLVRETDALGTTPPPQSTRQAIFDYIVAELNAAVADLPAVNAGEVGRADQGAARMLLAKVLMQAQAYGLQPRWNEAAAALAPVLAGSYTLETNYRRNFSGDNDQSNELIFQVVQDAERTQSFGGTTFLMNASVGGFRADSLQGVQGQLEGWWGLRLKPQMIALFPAIGPSSPDVRSSFWFAREPDQTTAMSQLTNFSNGTINLKYRNRPSAGGGQATRFSNIDYPMFRLADAYLMYAELALRGATGTTRAQALTYVNALRQRAYGNMNGNITDAQLTLPFILDERARELHWEGHRRVDLIRFGQFTGGDRLWAWKGNVVGGRATETFRNLYPKPASELVANPNLTQNTGY